MKLFSFVLVCSTLAFSAQSYAAGETVKEVDIKGLKVEIIRSREVGDPEKEKPVYHVVLGTDADGKAVNLGIFEKYYAGKSEQSRILNVCIRRIESLNLGDRLNIGGNGVDSKMLPGRVELTKLSHCSVIKAK